MKSVTKPRNHVFLAMRKTKVGGEHQKALRPSRARLKQSQRKELQLQLCAAQSGGKKISGHGL